MADDKQVTTTQNLDNLLSKCENMNSDVIFAVDCLGRNVTVKEFIKAMAEIKGLIPKK